MPPKKATKPSPKKAPPKARAAKALPHRRKDDELFAGIEVMAMPDGGYLVNISPTHGQRQRVAVNGVLVYDGTP